MNLPLLVAQVAGYDIGHLMIVLIVAAAVIGIGLVVARQMGVAIPEWLVKILWIIAAAVVGIAAIRFVLGLL